MDRRTFLHDAAVAVLGAPLFCVAQAAGATPRIGFLSAAQTPNEQYFWDELHRLGYVEGKNIIVESRTAQGDFSRLPTLAAELANLKVDVIVAVVTQASLAAKQATAMIPIVIVSVSDPVASGLVRNLARPEGNVTGTAGSSADVVAKQMELVRALLPRASRLAVLWNPGNAVFQEQQLQVARSAAAQLRMQLQLVEARRPDELERAFASISKANPDALLVLADPMLLSEANRTAELALKHRVPAVSWTRRFAEAGGMATFGQDFSESYRHAAVYVDKILKGAKPGELPIELPTKFELVINLKTAKALGLTIPQSVRLRADEVIQ